MRDLPGDFAEATSSSFWFVVHSLARWQTPLAREGQALMFVSNWRVERFLKISGRSVLNYTYFPHLYGRMSSHAAWLHWQAFGYHDACNTRTKGCPIMRFSPPPPAPPVLSGCVLQCHMSCELCVLCQNALLCVTGGLSRNACTPAAHSMHGTAMRTQRHASANGRGDGRGKSILIRHSACFPGSATGARLLGSEVATKKPQWGEPGSKKARKKAKDSVDGGPLKVGEDDQV